MDLDEPPFGFSSLESSDRSDHFRIQVGSWLDSGVVVQRIGIGVFHERVAVGFFSEFGQRDGDAFRQKRPS